MLASSVLSVRRPQVPASLGMVGLWRGPTASVLAPKEGTPKGCSLRRCGGQG